MRGRGVAACAAALPALLMLRRAMGGGGPTRWLWLGARGTTWASRRPDGTNMARSEDRFTARTGSEQEQDQSKNKIRASMGRTGRIGAFDHVKRFKNLLSMPWSVYHTKCEYRSFDF